MDFFIGDRVLFKNDNLRAEIVRINSPFKVTVISSDGFEMIVSVKDLVKIEKDTDKAASYGNNFNSKESKLKSFSSKKNQKRQRVLKVDLHIELLLSNYNDKDNFEIVQIQLNECHKKINKALSSDINRIEIIHGIGEGVLKKEVHNILRNYNLRFYLTKDGGATHVYL